MRAPLSRRRSWQWPLGLLALVALAQACGGGSSDTTGPAGASQISLHLRGLDAAELPQNCTGRLMVTGPGMETIDVAIPPTGTFTIVIPPGPSRTFTVTLTCQKTTGIKVFTAQKTLDVVLGTRIDLDLSLVVNEPPTAGASCSPSTITTDQSAQCGCRATDPDPFDQLVITWTASGGTVSPATGATTTFSSSQPGTFTVSCTVSDGKATRSATTTVTVGPAPGSITVINQSATSSVPDAVTFSGPGPIAPIIGLAPGGTATRTGVVPGSYVATYCFGNTVPFTVTSGQATTVMVNGGICG